MILGDLEVFGISCILVRWVAGEIDILHVTGQSAGRLGGVEMGIQMICI